MQCKIISFSLNVSILVQKLTKLIYFFIY